MNLALSLAERQGSIDWWVILLLLVACPIFLTLRAYYSRPAQPTRIVRRVPARLHELWGDDWRNGTQNFLPPTQKGEGRVAGTTDPLTIQGVETHGKHK